MLDNYQDLIDELLGTPQVVRDAIASGNPDVIRIVAGLRERDRIVLERIQRIKNQIDPYLKPVPDAAALEAAAGDPGDPTELGESFDSARGDLVSLLMNLTLRDWERTAITDEAGTITLADEVETHVEFDEDLRARLSAR
jgi:hypothetical protein